ncbi:hypothetical protein GEMRC1_011080 [Eukaryota sp. GEM-RC1]
MNVSVLTADDQAARPTVYENNQDISLTLNSPIFSPIGDAVHRQSSPHILADSNLSQSSTATSPPPHADHQPTSESLTITLKQSPVYNLFYQTPRTFSKTASEEDYENIIKRNMKYEQVLQRYSNARGLSLLVDHYTQTLSTVQRRQGVQHDSVQQQHQAVGYGDASTRVDIKKANKESLIKAFLSQRLDKNNTLDSKDIEKIFTLSHNDVSVMVFPDSAADLSSIPVLDSRDVKRESTFVITPQILDEVFVSSQLSSDMLKKSMEVSEHVIHQNLKISWINNVFDGSSDDSDSLPALKSAIVLKAKLFNISNINSIFPTAFATCKSSQYLAVGYGQYNSSEVKGLIAIYDLVYNSLYPISLFETPTPVVSISFPSFTKRPLFATAGLLNGLVVVADILNNSIIFQSSTSASHNGPVWSITWSEKPAGPNQKNSGRDHHEYRRGWMC